mgnify:CR=1 FL=1
MGQRYWLMKCEPSAYTIDDLARDGQTCWEGVRNYQARNLMRDDMGVGDGVVSTFTFSGVGDAEGCESELQVLMLNLTRSPRPTHFYAL